MPKRKKRELSESEDVSDATLQVAAAIPPCGIANYEPTEVARPERRMEAKFQLKRIDNTKTANQTERGLLKLISRICRLYSERYEVYSQSLVNQHLSIFSILGMPVELSAKSLSYGYWNAVGAHSACTEFIRANQRRAGDSYHFTQILRLFEQAERATNNFLYSRHALAVPSFKLERNTTVLFRQLATINSLITGRKWSELGRYLNSCPFLHAPLIAWMYTPQTKNKVTYVEKNYRSLRHDMFISALYVWQAATLRALQMEESREWASSRQLNLLRRAVKQCRITAAVRVPEHILLTDSVVVLLSLEEAYMVHHFHAIDINLHQSPDCYRNPFEAYKLLAQAWCWQQELRTISGVTDPGTKLVEELLEVAEREGSAGVVFALSALRGFMKIAEVIDDHSSLDRLLAYSIACPRAARPLAAQLREYGMEQQADEMIEKAIAPSSDVHPSDPVWLEWAEGRMRQVDEGDEETCTSVAAVLLEYLDYGSNRLHERAWILLEKALDGSDSSHWSEWWEDRAHWWPDLHEETIENKRAKKARKKVLKRFKKVRIE